MNYLLIAFAGWFTLALLVMNLIVIPEAKHQVMEQAYDLGYAVECPGKLGYHFVCEGENE